MDKDYKIVISQLETTDGWKWYAECPDLKGLIGGGDTPEEALSEMQENKQYWLDTEKKTDMDTSNRVKENAKCEKCCHFYTCSMKSPGGWCSIDNASVEYDDVCDKFKTRETIVRCIDVIEQFQEFVREHGNLEVYMFDISLYPRHLKNLSKYTDKYGNNGCMVQYE